MTLRWKDEPWASNPDPLLEALEALYSKALSLGKIKSPVAATAKKVRIIRGWCDAVPEEDLQAACAALEVVYIPRDVAPGPGLLFPIRDMTGEIRRAHIRVNDESIYGVRYISAVNRERFIGPAWLGTDDATLLAIIQRQEVCVVEGPLDLLACRVVNPSAPTLSSLTKKLGDSHLNYLRMLGVRCIHPMFDNQKTGADATEVMRRRVTDFDIEPIVCPAKDPSDALKDRTKLKVLRAELNWVPITNSPSNTTTYIDDDAFYLGGN